MGYQYSQLDERPGFYWDIADLTKRFEISPGWFSGCTVAGTGRRPRGISSRQVARPCWLRVGCHSTPVIENTASMPCEDSAPSSASLSECPAWTTMSRIGQCGLGFFHT